PPDRGKGAPQAAASVALAQAARVPRGKDVVELFGPIAQRLEPPAHNRPVPGSNPGGPSLRACTASSQPATHAARPPSRRGPSAGRRTSQGPMISVLDSRLRFGGAFFFLPTPDAC